MILLNSTQKLLDYSEIMDNHYAYDALKFSLSFYNFYQLKNLTMKISHSIIKDSKSDKIDSIHTESLKKSLVFKSLSQKTKLQKLVALVLNKLNSDTLKDLQTFLDEN